MAQKVPDPLGDTTPLKDSPPLKFQKSSAPGKNTTSKFTNPPKIRGVHTLYVPLKGSLLVKALPLAVLTFQTGLIA